MNMPVVLGIHAFGHEAGACVATPDGLFALSEERLSRIKYDGAFPARSMDWALGASGVGDLANVDLVVYDLLEQAGPRVLQALSDLGYTGEIRACRHHEAHAASAFFPSLFERAAVLTIDAGGSRECEHGPGIEPSPGRESHPMHQEVQAWFCGRGRSLETLRRTVVGPPYSINPGVLYGMTSVFLGFGPLGAGKVMGLAAHGRPEPGFSTPIFDDIDGDPLAKCPAQDPLQESVMRGFLPRLFGGVAPRTAGDPLDDRHRAVAAHVQEQTQHAVLDMVRRLAAVAACDRLCLAGGFGLNALTNTAILRRTPFEDLFVQPAATDAGIPLGCALWGYHVVLEQERCFEMRTAFLGGEYGEREIEAALERCAGLEVRRCEGIERPAAEALARGEIIGWFQGRSEFGPRALGHRSILADPRDPRSVARLNEDIKFRESFRPYAPAVLEESAGSCFDLPARSPFMLLIAPVRQAWRSRLPAVTHVDGTARVQTVSGQDQPSLFGLLTEFERRAGVPVLLNTSFNRAGEPMVETPADALRMFQATGLDALAVEDFWIEKRAARTRGEP